MNYISPTASSLNALRNAGFSYFHSSRTNSLTVYRNGRQIAHYELSNTGDAAAFNLFIRGIAA